MYEEQCRWCIYRTSCFRIEKLIDVRCGHKVPILCPFCTKMSDCPPDRFEKGLTTVCKWFSNEIPIK